MLPLVFSPIQSRLPAVPHLVLSVQFIQKVVDRTTETMFLNSSLYCIYLDCTPLYCYAVNWSVLRCTVLHWASLQYTYFTTLLYFTALHSTSVQRTVLQCRAQYFSAVHITSVQCTLLLCSAHYFSAVHITSVQCTVLQCSAHYFSTVQSTALDQTSSPAG